MNYTKVIFEFYVKENLVDKIFVCRRWFYNKSNRNEIENTLIHDIKHNNYKYNVVGFNILKISYHLNIEGKDKLATTKIMHKRVDDIKKTENQYPYRFKTEAEFIKKFGSNWKNVIKKSWVKEMDDLLGKTYPFNVECKCLKLSFHDGWAVTWDMLTENIELPKNGGMFDIEKFLLEYLQEDVITDKKLIDNIKKRKKKIRSKLFPS